MLSQQDLAKSIDEYWACAPSNYVLLECNFVDCDHYQNGCGDIMITVPNKKAPYIFLMPSPIEFQTSSELCYKIQLAMERSPYTCVSGDGLELFDDNGGRIPKNFFRIKTYHTYVHRMLYASNNVPEAFRASLP